MVFYVMWVSMIKGIFVGQGEMVCPVLKPTWRTIDCALDQSPWLHEKWPTHRLQTAFNLRLGDFLRILGKLRTIF